MRRVYQFGLRPPIEASVVRDQLRAAHEYRNDLVAIERGRRHALRAVDDTDEVREAISTVLASTKSTRKDAITKLRLARKQARADKQDELDRIQALDETIRRDTRALTRCYWGSYLDIESRHQQARSAPLYGDDAITPSDPRFERWRGYDEGQIGVQLQKGLSTADVRAGRDTRVRLVGGVLWLRVGSSGRDPVWAQWPINMHREVPSSALWKWVRVSCRREGLIEQWSCEITVDDPAPSPRSLDRELKGAVAVEWEWSPLADGGIRVARWADTFGQSGEVVLSAYDVSGIRKGDGIRAVRDISANDMRPKLARAIRECGEDIPLWLAQAAATIHLWKSLGRFHELWSRWIREKCDAARPAFELLDAWYMRDSHLYQYEASGRRQALRRRRDRYRVLAAEWSRRYRHVLLSDQDLSREARWGEEGDVRFTAGVSELRQCLRNAFGYDAIDTRWRDEPAEEEPREWCERTRDAWMAGGARGDGRFAERKEKVANAWAARKARKVEKQLEKDAARKQSGNDTESLGP